MSIRSLFCLALLLAFPAVAPNAQQATEMYIPIGASPGVSTITSIIGKIAAVDEQNRTITVSDASGTATVAVPDETPVWLDRSKATGTNQRGSAADLKAGLTVEVKYREAARGSSLTAEWIKIEMTK
ncbi:MAG TPA: hypothetical protein VLU73_00445 [Methylococcaceae bacterium]|nr:hypothetical protein [Methylococcaceae bacterium]